MACIVQAYFCSDNLPQGKVLTPRKVRFQVRILATHLGKIQSWLGKVHLHLDTKFLKMSSMYLSQIKWAKFIVLSVLKLNVHLWMACSRCEWSIASNMNRSILKSRWSENLQYQTESLRFSVRVQHFREKARNDSDLSPFLDVLCFIGKNLSVLNTFS